MSKTFSYSYMTFTVTARVGDSLEIKQGLRTQTVPLEALRFLYVQMQGDHQELIVAYDKPNGSRGILRTYSNAGDTQFKALVDDLAALKPNADLRGKPRREALQTMGARDTQLIAMVAVPAVVMVVLFGALSPFIIHGFDKGSQRVSASELKQAKLTTSNLVLSGELDLDRYLEVTTTKNGVKQSSSYQFPVFPRGASDDAPIPVVLKTSELSDAALERLADQGEWKCTLRNVLWEGMDGDDRTYMRDTLHLDVTDDTMLCELADKDEPPIWLMLGGLVCSGLFVSGIIVLALWMQRRKQR